jgi:uncharacterized damage-inducible protein DinB
MEGFAEYARTMARYNAWMNTRLYDCCAGIPDAERKRDVGAFFKSIHGTLNHLLVGDRIWMGRFTGRPFVVKSLATELHADFDDLRRERTATDAEIGSWVAARQPGDFAGTLTYTTIVNPRTMSQPLWLPVAHMFNHQTHHRGQLTTLLMQRGIDPGVTDLLAVPPPG